MTTTIRVNFLIVGAIIAAVFAIGVLHHADTHTTVLCYASTEHPVLDADPDEELYPAWELECEGTHRVIVLD